MDKTITDKNELKEYQIYRHQLVLQGTIKVDDFETIYYYTNYKYQYEYHYKNGVLNKVRLWDTN